MPTVKVAVVQEPSAVLDRERGLAAVAQRISDAAADGTDLVVFGETFRGPDTFALTVDRHPRPPLTLAD